MLPPAGTPLDALPWTDNVQADYDAACARCEKHIILDKDHHNLLCRTLNLVPTRGMVLVADLPALQPLKHDRLEPSRTLPDVVKIFEVTVFPFPIVVWRSSADSLARHRNPLFSEELGITICDTLTVDTLHC